MNDGIEHRLAEIVWGVDSVFDLDMLDTVWVSLIEVRRNRLEEMNQL